MKWANRLSCIVAAYAGHPLAQLGFLAFCLLWWSMGWDMLGLTTVLSIIAITLTQMVLASQDRITKAEHMKLDAIIAGTDADDELRGIENKEDDQ